MPPAHRRFHSIRPLTLTGTAQVTRGKGPLAAGIAALFRLPKAGADIPVQVTMTRTDTGETWLRDFDGARFTSFLRPSPMPGHFRERFGLLTFDVHLKVQNGALHLPVTRGSCLGLPMPRWSLPRSDSVERVEGRQLRFDVVLHMPMGLGMIIRYRGALS